MPRGLDHIVHAVRDLDAAGALYERLGFTVGARNRHSWGTHNRLVQLPDFLTRHEGFSLLILESGDAAAAAAAYQVAGIAASDVLRFERQGKRPDGSAVKVAFSLAFAREIGSSDIGFAVCQQHFPENFWNPAFQTHPNTAQRINGVVMVADNPADHHIFLSAFAGERDLAATSSGVVMKTPRGDIAVMDPGAFSLHFGVAAPTANTGLRLAALRFGVRDMATAVKLLQAAGVAAVMRMGRVIVAPSSAMGATLVFEPVG